MAFNYEGDINNRTLNGTKVNRVDNFKYLGGWMSCSEKDFNIRKALAWTVCNDMKKVWTSKLSKNFKLRMFQATVQYVLTYNAETWTINKTLEKRIDGVYTRMLRVALNITWKQRLTNEELYGNLPKISEVIREKRLKIAGHCVRHKEEIANQLVFWQPTRGKRKRGRQAVTYVDCLLQDTGLEEVNELKTLMQDRTQWSNEIKLGRAGARPR